MRTQNRSQFPAIILAIFLVFLVTNCTVDKDENKLVIATVDVTEVKSIEALCSALIISDGGKEITARGVCWSTDPNPTFDDNKTSDGAGAGSFKSHLTDLQPKTIYYVRAYAVNSEGTGYGMALAFETIATTEITTAEVTAIESTTAVCGGTITSDGGYAITARGVCWSTSPDSVDLEIASGFTVNGSGIGTFESRLTNLTPNTTYYVRAYATSSIETNYGNIISFQTHKSQAPTLTTSSVVSITHTTAESGGNISSDGGATVLERGVCWSTDPNPTIEDNKTSDGTGTGEFTSTLTNLSPETTHYLRAYATNSVGTAYGETVIFTTTALPENSFFDNRDGNVYKYVTIGSQVWMAENLKYLPEVHSIADFKTKGNNSQPGYGVYGYAGSDVATAKSQANYATYGVLYNWYAVNSGNLCPNGWHVATDAEWTELTEYLGEESFVGGKLKETGTSHWYSPNEGATNETGFTALPGGFRGSNTGTFYSIGNYGNWWCATEYDNNNAWYRDMYYDYSIVGRYDIIKGLGFSVRCIKD